MKYEYLIYIYNLFNLISYLMFVEDLNLITFDISIITARASDDKIPQR